MNDLRGHFRPEFLNRLDEILMFKPLTKENLSRIVELLITSLRSRLADKTLSLAITEKAKELIIARGYDPLYGARPLKRYLQSAVETLLAKTILASDPAPGSTLKVDASDGELNVTVE